jgi:hypothetical protein
MTSDRKEKLARALLRQLREEFDEEDDQLQVVNLLMSLVSVKTDISKLHASGLAEMQSCTKIGLVWNRSDVKGCDATDKKGRGVEIKTYKRVQNANRFSINYVFPARKEKEPDDEFRIRAVNYFLESKKFEGGHYWVAFNQTKTEIYRWNYVEKETVADLVSAYLKRVPGSKSINFGGTICATCKRCHKVDDMSKLYLPKDSPQIMCKRK